MHIEPNSAATTRGLANADLRLDIVPPELRSQSGTYPPAREQGPEIFVTFHVSVRLSMLTIEGNILPLVFAGPCDCRVVRARHRVAHHCAALSPGKARNSHSVSLERQRY